MIGASAPTRLNGQRHIQYFVNCLKKLPRPYTGHDTNRLTLAHFAIQSLDILGFFDIPQNLELYNIDKRAIIDWIYSLQTLVPTANTNTNTDAAPDSKSNSNWRYGGFKGGAYLGPAPIPCPQGWSEYDNSHIAMTYVGLCTLATLGDDLARVHKESIVRVMRETQLDDGSFKSTISGSENDMRFVYCACAISHMLDDWTGIDIPRTLDYIRRCRTWDGGIGLTPGQEGHGGSVFCATASLRLMGKLEDVLDEDLGGGGDDTWRKELVRWCVSRQLRGMQGRPNKQEDTCYSYWIGGSLRLLGCDELLDIGELRGFVLRCQTDLGGFSKLEGGYFPDLLHSFYSLAWLSISQSSMANRDTIAEGGNSLDASGGGMTKIMTGGFILNALDCTLGLVSKRIDVFQT